MLKDRGQVKVIQDYLQAQSNSTPKSCYDSRHQELNFEPGGYAYLRATPNERIKKVLYPWKVCSWIHKIFPGIARRMAGVSWKFASGPVESSHIPIVIIYRTPSQAGRWKNWNQCEVWHMRKNPSEFWIRWNKPPRSKVIRFYKVHGNTIQRKRVPKREKGILNVQHTS